MGSIGSKTTTAPDVFGGYLGERENVDAIQRLTWVNDYNIINPNYSMNSKYRTNCALCATAVGLQAQGYNVEAMPRDKEWRGPGEIFDFDYTNTDNYMLSGSKYYNSSILSAGQVRNKYGVNNPPRAGRGADAVADQIIEKAKKWGNGGVGYLSVKWKDSNSSHAVNIINQNGRVFGYDSQSNKIIHDLHKYLKRTVANHTALMRLDNAKIKDNISKDTLDKMFKQSSRKPK